ncbi:MAG: hypothetical protein R2769_17120 [Saprospiraceae bacterium]
MRLCFFGLLGAVAGIIASLPLVYYFNTHPVDFSKISKDMEQAYEKFGFEPSFFRLPLTGKYFYPGDSCSSPNNTIMALYPLTKNPQTQSRSGDEHKKNRQ